MKSKIFILVLMCLIMAGCLENTRNNFAPFQSGFGRIPDPYYAQATPWLDQSVFGIEALIGPGFLRSYSANSFDCSEMAAYLEWMLEKHGFDSKVCLASQFGEDNAPHAWVAVDLPSKRYYVEPTARNEGGFTFSIIKPLDAEYQEYSKYDGIYEDIYELAEAGPVSEFNWWADPVLKHNLVEAHYSPEE